MSAQAVAVKPAKSAKGSTSKGGRYSTSDSVRLIVWMKAAGHCEMCGLDLTTDPRLRSLKRWGEVAHVLPASAKGPRAEHGHDDARAKQLTNDPTNLMLLCPNCHTSIDADDEGYPATDLTGLHSAQVRRVALTAAAPDSQRAVALTMLSRHFLTQNDIPDREMRMAMIGEGLVPVGETERIVLAEPKSTGRDSAYWDGVRDAVTTKVTAALRRSASMHGDVPILAVAGLADIPALMLFGLTVGDRLGRRLFSPHRQHGLRWPEPQAAPPAFVYAPPPDGYGPIALVLSLSATVPLRDVEAALPNGRIAMFTVDQPSVGIVRNRGCIGAFRDALQARLSELEASSALPIHVFAAIPAAFAIEFGALLSMNHRHPYLVYDRQTNNAFEPALTIDSKEHA